MDAGSSKAAGTRSRRVAHVHYKHAHRLSKLLSPPPPNNVPTLPTQPALPETLARGWHALSTATCIPKSMNLESATTSLNCSHGWPGKQAWVQVVHQAP